MGCLCLVLGNRFSNPQLKCEKTFIIDYSGGENWYIVFSRIVSGRSPKGT